MALTKAHREFIDDAKRLGVDVVGVENGGKHVKLVYRTAGGALSKFPLVKAESRRSRRNLLADLRRSVSVSP